MIGVLIQQLVLFAVRPFAVLAQMLPLPEPTQIGIGFVALALTFHLARAHKGATVWLFGFLIAGNLWAVVASHFR